MSNTVQQTTDNNFAQDVLAGDKPVLVDFWAPWCQPCKAMAPLLEKLAVDYADKLMIYKLNVDENPETAKQYRIQGLPTLAIFKDKELQSVQVGALHYEALKQWLEGVI